MRALLRILHLFVAFGLLVPATTQPATLGSGGVESHCRSAPLERIALAHGQQDQTRASAAIEGSSRGNAAPEQGAGAAPELALEHATRSTPETCTRQSIRARERAQLALAHLRVNGSANAAGSRA